MKLLKHAAFFVALALVLGIGVSTVAADSAVVQAPEQNSTTVDLVFGPSWGQVTVCALPGSFYTVKCPDPSGNPMTLANGFVDQSGSGRSMFPVMPMLNVHSITVQVNTPGLPPMLFAYDSDLDRWILD